MTKSEYKKEVIEFLLDSTGVTLRGIALKVGLDPAKSEIKTILKEMMESNQVAEDEGVYYITEYGLAQRGKSGGLQEGSAVDAVLKHIEKEEKLRGVVEVETQIPALMETPKEAVVKKEVVKKETKSAVEGAVAHEYHLLIKKQQRRKDWALKSIKEADEVIAYLETQMKGLSQ